MIIYKTTNLINGKQYIGKDANNNIRRDKVEPLYVDHCHKTNTLRDLLCHQCNSFLGHAKDNIEILQKAIDYLHKHML